MADMRSCVKTGCRWPAAATLSYRYQSAEVWLSDLAEAHPSTHDLCPHHADALRVPRGWTLVDDRRPQQAVHEPSAAELVERVETLRRSVDRMLGDPVQPPPTRRSRYAELLASLPRHEPPTEDGDAPPPPDPAPPPARGGEGAASALAHVGAAALPPIAHELAPVLPLRPDGGPGPG